MRGGKHVSQKSLDEFCKKKDWLVCIDSDGTAMDTMTVKHKKIFGPCIVKEWNLEQWGEDILDRWNEINLYTLKSRQIIHRSQCDLV